MAKDKTSNLEERLSNINKRLFETEKNFNALYSRSSSSHKFLDSLESSIDQMEKEILALRAKNLDLQKKSHDYFIKLSAKKSELNQSNIESIALKKDLATANSLVKKLKISHASIETVNNSIKAKLDNQINEKKKLDEEFAVVVKAKENLLKEKERIFKDQGKYIISGPIEVLNYSYFPHDFPNTFATAPDIRKMLTKAGWSKTVAFQTRNPMHRAHEELCKMAYERLEADGVLIHMLLGKLKEGDIPGDVRDAAIRKMVELYFEENTAIISGFGFDMMYAGPREALLHAVFRQNAGCTHLIVGRDHAGVGDYYEPFEAQEIFDLDIVKDSLKIEIFKADHTAYSKKLDKVVMMRDAEDHSKDDFVLLSGTKVREMLAAGQDLPPEFARKEVAKILMTYYQERS